LGKNFESGFEDEIEDLQDKLIFSSPSLSKKNK